MIPASKVVMALADLASQGVYNNVTPQGARNMNAVFERTAELINKLEEQELQNAAASQLADDELTNEGGPTNESI